MTSNIKKINNCFSRVYADIKISDGAFSIHLMDITSGDLNNSFWDFLNDNIKLSFKPIKNISKKYLKNLNFIEPDDTISLINNSLISLYKKADLFDSNTNINTKAVTKLNIDYSAQEESVSFVNKTNNLIKITGNEDHLFPLSSIFLENKDSSPISYLIPNNYNFVAGNSPFNSQSIDKLQLDQNLDEVFKAFLNTLNHISEIYFESIQNRSLKYLKDEKESFDFGTATLGDFLPKIVNEDTKDIGSSSKFENVYFAVGKILRVESRASELYPYVDFSDCDTEYDATIKLLNTSGVPYRVSEAPSRYIDDRSKESQRFSSEATLDAVHKLRSYSDGILVGVNTVIRDNPLLNVRRINNEHIKHPLRIVMDGNLRIPLESKLLNDEMPTLVVYSNENKEKIQQLKRKNKVELLKIKKSEDGKIEPIELLKKLGERGLQELLIEGGTNTARRFVESNLIDRILMFRSPISFKDPVKGLTGQEIVGLGLERLTDLYYEDDCLERWCRNSWPTEKWP